MVKMDIDMPKNCLHCPFTTKIENTYRSVCSINKKFNKIFYDIPWDKLDERPDWCPLIEDKEEEEIINK